MNEFFTLKNGEKLIIRETQAKDYEAVMLFLDRLSKETVFTNQYPGQPYQDKENSIRIYELPTNLFLSAFAENGEIVGQISIAINKPGHPWTGRNASFGISILKAYYGLGLGTYLMQKIEEWARKQNLHRIEGLVRSTNKRGINLYLKQGFEIDGLFHEVAFINGEWHNEYHISKILK